MNETLPGADLEQLSPLVLAYVGDAVFELLARHYVVSRQRGRVRDLHQATVALVRASAQADFLQRIEPALTSEEKDVVRRGRNTKSSAPKNADLIAYRQSTGLEALWGYLYLHGDEARITALFARGIEV
jgi:ribonuclease-3 family protein